MIKIGNSASNISFYSCQPKTRDELRDIIEDRISKEGPNCDLNDIDVSLIDDMSNLFNGDDFNGDISRWDVSNVDEMTGLFSFSKFNQDISKWDVSNVKNMSWMFYGSEFDKDISNWKIKNNCDTFLMLHNCPIKESHRPKSLK